MLADSVFLSGLIGRPVRIVAVDEAELPPMILEEVSSLGIVAAEPKAAHFLPWREVVEIAPADEPVPPRAEEPADVVAAALSVDSEL